MLKQEGELLLAIATISGCPKYNDVSGIIEVDDIFFHKGDVDLASGNIKASGSVEISGNVAEGTKVECEGSQEIFGTVTGAELKAWGNIKIKGNVFKSDISAGKDSQWIHKWSSLLGVVEEHLACIMEIEAQNNRLAQEASQAGLEDNMEAIQRLYEGGVLFDYFRQLIFALASLYKEDLSPLPEEIRAKILGTRDRIAEGSGSIFDRTRPIEEDVAGIRTWICLLYTSVRSAAGYGVVGTLKGLGNRTIALRADIDALPVTEETGLPYASEVPGQMHACGHDAHVAIVLGAAKILSRLRGHLNGNVRFIFQPGEEGPGGAQPMIDDGVLESPKVDAIIGGHVGMLWPVESGLSLIHIWHRRNGRTMEKRNFP